MYQKIIDSFEIEKGSRIWLSSDVTKIAYIMKKAGEKFEPLKLLDYFKNVVGEGGTIMLPTFCFDFSNKGRYDYQHSKGVTGILGNVALEKGDFIRTKHPMHSFAVWGHDRDILYDMENRHAFGKDSPFEYCNSKNVLQIMLGTDYVHAMTFVHYAETMCNVPYRFNKSFTGIYVTESGKEEERTYDYAARKLYVGTTEKFNRIGKILEEKGVAQEIMFNNCIVSHKVCLGNSYNFICDDILHNQCRNIYDFTVPREKVFEGYGEDI